MVDTMMSSPGKPGISLLDEISRGTHFCHLYQTTDNLLEALKPYFKAGLEAKQFCMCVIPEPLSRVKVRNALRPAVRDFELKEARQRQAKGQL